MSKDYTKYDVLDFVDETTFVEFVRKSNQNSVAFWNKWIQDNPEKADKIEEASAFIQAIQIDEPDIPKTKTDALFSRISDNIESTETIHSKRRIIPLWRYAAAAAIVLLIGIWTFWPTADLYRTEFGITKMVELPDESKVNLNAGSVLSFKSTRWDEKREVNLSGEAFFEVEKGSTFVVNTDLGKVEVLGTSFNVLNRGDYFEVQCITGRVRVSTKDQKMSQEIVPNEGVYYNNQTGAFDIKSISSTENLWTRGNVNFSDKPLEFVFDELERQYDIEISHSRNLGTFNGTLTLSDLNEALYDVCWPMKLKYEIKNDQVIIAK